MGTKKFITVSILALSITTLASCTNDQINGAIEACKGDPECYLIIDEAIEEELESRGINGGAMTNIELEKVIEILADQIYPIYSPRDEIVFLNALNTGGFLNEFTDGGEPEFIVSNGLRFTLNDVYSQWIMRREGVPSIGSGENLNYYLNLVDKLDEPKQLFVYENEKYILYKVGANRFIYEVSGQNENHNFLIDLDLNTVYRNNLRLFNIFTFFNDNLLLEINGFEGNGYLFNQDQFNYLHLKKTTYNLPWHFGFGFVKGDFTFTLKNATYNESMIFVTYVFAPGFMNSITINSSNLNGVELSANYPNDLTNLMEIPNTVSLVNEDDLYGSILNLMFSSANFFIE